MKNAMYMVGRVLLTAVQIPITILSFIICVLMAVYTGLRYRYTWDEFVEFVSKIWAIEVWHFVNHWDYIRYGKNYEGYQEYMDDVEEAINHLLAMLKK